MKTLLRTPALPHSQRQRPPSAPNCTTEYRLLGAMMLAATATGSPAWAQATEHQAEVASAALSTVVIKGEDTAPAGKYSLRATETRIGKGRQALTDIPQTVTVMTEKLMDDRNLDDLRQVLKTTAGVTFQAGETGEEDVRLRGFSLQQAGDLYVDGLRDAPLIERDTFNLDRVEVLKGSASMLFGKGSTGGVVNQVSKSPFLMDQHEVNLTVGSGNERRVAADFNFKTGENAAVRLNLMQHDADRYGAQVHKRGVAPTLRWGIGMRDEFTLGLYHLETDGRPLYNHPWVLSADNKIIPTLPAKNYYGLASDYLRTQTNVLTFGHTHRFDHESELKTTVRHGRYERDLWASAIGFCRNASGVCSGQNITDLSQITPSTVLTRSPKGRRGESELTQVQTDLTRSFEAWGLRHRAIAGAELYEERAQRNNNAAGASLAGTPQYSTLVGTPDDGQWRADTRTVPMAHFNARSLGLYAQDTVSLTQTLKLLGGLRYDHFQAGYTDLSGNRFDMAKDLWSQRVGLMFQPNAQSSYYASYGNSYNTSGDTYLYTVNLVFDPASSNAQQRNNAYLAHTPPEQSRNLEIGSKFELLDKKVLLGIAAFRTEKFNERNTDADSATQQYLLSGKRHATGMEFNLAGRLNAQWEMFYSHTWIPEARIDQRTAGVSDNANTLVQGDRPGLTPKHSASLWTTYRVLPMVRLGLGLNHRSEQTTALNRRTAQAFNTADAMAEYTASEHTTVKLNVTNLTDKRYADGLYNAFYTPGAPRMVQLSLKTTF